jgi:hypothetical protein
MSACGGRCPVPRSWLQLFADSVSSQVAAVRDPYGSPRGVALSVPNMTINTSGIVKQNPKLIIRKMMGSSEIISRSKMMKVAGTISVRMTLNLFLAIPCVSRSFSLNVIKPMPGHRIRPMASTFHKLRGDGRASQSAPHPCSQSMET